jgi:VanZ family protein
MQSFLKYWKSILAVFFILYLSFAPPSTFSELPSFKYADKLVHFFMYFFFTFILIYDFIHNQKKLKQPSFLFICVLFPVLLGGIIEVLQNLFFRPRTAEWLDWICDLVGILISLLLFFIFYVLTKKSFKKSEG